MSEPLTIAVPIGFERGVVLRGLKIVQNSQTGLELADGEVAIDPKRPVHHLDADGRVALIAAARDAMTATGFVEATLADGARDLDELHKGDCKPAGIAVLDIIVNFAARIRRLPDDYESDEMRAFDRETDRLYDAIVEGRRGDAIEILSELTGERLRRVAEQRNLFPDRVPA